MKSRQRLILDIGTKTLEKYKNGNLRSKTIFLNETMGFYETFVFRMAPRTF